MENFNKNWLAIILIVVVFTAIGFLFGHMVASHHQKGFHKGMKENMMFMRHGGPGCCDEFNMPLDDEALDSLQNVDVKVWVEKDGDVMKSDTVKKIIVKKIVN